MEEIVYSDGQYRALFLSAAAPGRVVRFYKYVAGEATDVIIPASRCTSALYPLCAFD
jgi:hypothetical protein